MLLNLVWNHFFSIIVWIYKLLSRIICCHPSLRISVLSDRTFWWINLSIYHWKVKMVYMIFACCNIEWEIWEWSLRWYVRSLGAIVVLIFSAFWGCFFNSLKIKCLELTHRQSPSSRNSSCPSWMTSWTESMVGCQSGLGNIIYLTKITMRKIN